MKLRRKILLGLLPLALGSLLAFAIAKPAAAALDDGIMSKVYRALIYRCYTGGQINSKVENQNQDLWDYNLGGNKSLVKATTTNNKYALLPDGETNINGDSISCAELFVGGSGFSGLNSMYNLPTSNNKAYLEKLGYEEAMTGLTGSSKTCFKPTFTLGVVIEERVNLIKWEAQGGLTSTSTSNGPEACFDTDSNGVIQAKGTKGASGNSHDGAITYDVSIEGNYVAFSIEAAAGSSEYVSLPYTIGSTKVSDLENSLKSELSGKTINVTNNHEVDPNPVNGNPQRTRQVLRFDNVTSSQSPGGSETGIYTFCNNSATCAANRADQNILGSSDRTLTKDQVTTIYLGYIDRYTNYSCEENDVKSDNGTNRKVQLKVGGTWKNCVITSAYKESFNGADSNGVFGVKISLDGIIKYLGTIDEEEDDSKSLDRDNNVGSNPSTPENESGNASDAEDVCYGSAGTLGMGWVLCPILSGTSNALNWVYDSIVKDYLEVKPGLVSNDDVYKNWQLFQNIANIIMVIFLLVVVFSQLTGIGIDNYGIKKILPRLIICAILINLSYFIVQFLVDVSNIIGASIAGIFQIQGSGVSADSYSGLDIPSNILGISIVTAFGAGVAAVVANPAILLSFLLVILSGLISVLMMWLILVARQAGVVIAVVIAPLAFAMYLLPNTSKFTKSWGNIVKGLLLLYPLAALLIGASFFASNLIASLGDNFALPAMLLRVVPFFALPSLFRKSIDAIGNIGTKIQGFGRSLGRGATGAVRGSDAFKNAQERGMERRTRIRAGLDRNGNEATGWRGLLRSRSARDRARYRSQSLKNQSDQNRADLLNDPEYIEAMRQKQAIQDQAEHNEIELMNNPDYRAAVAAKQATDLEKKQTEAQASALITGAFRTTDGTLVDSSSIDTDSADSLSLQSALIAEASRDGKQDIGKIRALYDALLAKGDDGIDALAKVWDSGKLKGAGLSRIMDNVASDGNIKAKARSFHATANEVMSGSKSYDTSGGQVEAARVAGTYASKIKPEMISNMTDNERDNYINYASTTGNSDAMRNIYAASQNINSFKPNERTAVYKIADRYVQDHMELAKAGTYTYKDVNGNTQTAQLRRDANNVLVMDVTRPDGTVVASPITSDFCKSGDFRLKRN
ncbi:hypothetical protein IJG90_04510 [Candidatus Saccharibacteria bacterium]|nr:hypothetical protein [Candidatus Saccharibacteria bacterium]